MATARTCQFAVLEDGDALWRAFQGWLDTQDIDKANGPGDLASACRDGVPDVDVLLMHVAPGQEAAAHQVIEAALARPETAVVVAVDAPNDDDLAVYSHMGVVAYVAMPIGPEKVESLTRAIDGRLRRTADEADGYVVSTDRGRWIEITAASRSEFVTRFSKLVGSACGPELSEKDRHQLTVAVHEMGQNAVEWGNTYSDDKKVRFSYCVLDDEILIKVEDEGAGFDPRAVPDPTGDPLAHMERRLGAGKRPGGYGLHLVRCFMDEVTYNQKGNILIMRKTLRRR